MFSFICVFLIINMRIVSAAVFACRAYLKANADLTHTSSMFYYSVFYVLINVISRSHGDNSSCGASHSSGVPP